MEKGKDEEVEKPDCKEERKEGRKGGRAEGKSMVRGGEMFVFFE